jgi:thiol-disulfide isomerase/thioredoxin
MFSARHVRSFAVSTLLLCASLPQLAQEATGGPTNEKAQKTYRNALKSVGERKLYAALDDFAKADKQDGGHCLACQTKMIIYGEDLQHWNVAETAAGEMVAEAQGPENAARAHYQFGMVLTREAGARNKNDLYARAHDEFSKALAGAPNFPSAMFADGFVLAQLKQDEPAKALFEKFVASKSVDDLRRKRSLRYIGNMELARARMAPPFAFTTSDGQRVSMDELQGKVVLIDFWATWCGPCREALPRVKKIAKNFAGQPLVVLSVSVDTDEDKWKEFVG